MKTLLSIVSIICALQLGTARAAADELDARAVFEKGIDLFKAREYSAAAAAFRKANELKPNWKILYNIGQSEAAAKRHGLALQAFESYLSQGGDDVSDDRESELEKEIERLRKIVGFLKITAPDGVAVVVDGLDRGRAPLSGGLPVAASVEHQVHVGDSPSRTVMVSGGQTAEVVFVESERVGQKQDEPEAETVEQEPAAAEEEPGPSLKTWGWIAVGVGGAVLATSIVTGSLAVSADGDVKDRCPEGCYDDQYDRLDRRDNLALATDVLIGVGATAAVAGTVMLIVAYKRDREKESVVLHPVVAPGMAGASLEWRF